MTTNVTVLNTRNGHVIATFKGAYLHVNHNGVAHIFREGSQNMELIAAVGLDEVLVQQYVTGD